MNSELSVLIVDDEAELRRTIGSVLCSVLPQYSIKIEEAGTGREAVEKVQAHSFDLVLMDVRMPEMTGLEALQAIKEIDPSIFVVILTAHSSLQDAVTAIKHGAYDYIEKPIQPDQLSQIVKQALDTREIVSDLAVARPIFDDDVETEFVGSSKKMAEIFHLINRLSQVDTTVLIRGENGTGKELVAKAIHLNSPRKHGTFVAINCGAIPDNLMESELFGHEKGAFTDAFERKIGKFQIANKGTIFLDEIGELKPEMQVKLLRVLQERRFVPVGGNREIRTDARIIAATNQNLERMIEEGRFREDLFYRLNVMPIFIPPLRERIDDLPELIHYFLKKFALTHQRPLTGIEPGALDALQHYNFPGNIRELENIIERAFVIESGNTLTSAALPQAVLDQQAQHINIDLPNHYTGPLDFDRFKEETEKEFIVQALKANRGRINKTVAQANIPKNTLLRKIKKYAINVKEYSQGAEQTDSFL